MFPMGCMGVLLLKPSKKAARSAAFLEKIKGKMSVRAAIAIGKIGVKGDQYAPISALVIVSMIAATARIIFDIHTISDRG